MEFIGGDMLDILYILGVVIFFLGCYGLIKGLEKL